MSPQPRTVAGTGPGRRRFLALAGLAGASLSCSSRRGPTRDPETLILAVRADPTGFYPNPPIVNEAFTTQVNWNLFEGLVRMDRDLYLKPALAERWSSNLEQRSEVFELRRGLQFSDGRPVTARDVVVSLLRGREAVYQDSLHSITEALALDDGRVEVRTRTGSLTLISRLPWGLVLPAAAWDRSPVPAIGTGPYRLDEWQRGERVVFSANPRYRGRSPAYRRVVYRVLPEAQARIDAVVSGEADAADSLPLEQAEPLSRQAGLRAMVRDGLRVIFLALRPHGRPFDDPRVRRAVNLAIDRAELLRRVMGGRGLAASQLVPPALPGYNPEIPVAVRNLPKARALLAAAGYSNGLEVDFHGPNNRYLNDTEVLNEVARQLAEAGIRARVQALDKSVFFRLATLGQTRLHLIGWSSESGDAGDALDSLAHSKVGGLGAENDVDLADAEVDRLVESSNETLDGAERLSRLKVAMAHLMSLDVYLPLYVQPESALVSSGIFWDPAPSLGFVPYEMRPLASS